MAFKIRTGYEGDLSLFKTPQSIASYGALLLVLCAAPFLLGSYFLSQIVFVMIYTIVGIGLVLLSGYAGQTSIGHAAFLAIGAYIAANATKFGVPLYIYLPAAGLLTGLVGWLVGLPALRLHGIYLAIATFAFALIVEEILARWETVTHGNEGLMVKPASLFGQPLGEWGLYYLCIGVTIFVIVIAVNVIRSPTGRAVLALRDSETAARSMGVDSARYKTFAFALSAGMTGLAGVLYAHKMSFISPEMFTLALSIEFVMIIIIGGIASLRGAALGAVFMIMVDPVLVLIKDKLPALIGSVTGSPMAQDKASDEEGAAIDIESILAALVKELNGQRFEALRYSGPGTNLTIGLADGHEWQGGASTAKNGITCNANIPTEEVFTTPHARRVEGHVASTKPLSYQGTLIDEISVRFEGGRIVEAKASRGEEVLQKVLDTDEGARRLGEVALVPHSSPISASGLLFYNTLFDENASCHIALGQCYAKCFLNGTSLTPEQIAAQGGNKSLIHIDWMIGSDKIDIDGVKADGSRMPVFRKGEWA